MDKQFNGWTVLAILLILVVGYGFAAFNMRLLIPATTAQIAGNQGLVQQLNQALTDRQAADAKWQASVETRLEVLEKK